MQFGLGIPVRWKFRRMEMIPLIDAVFEEKTEIPEGIVVLSAVSLIEQASKYEGKPCQCFNMPATEQELTVSFSLIFPSEEKRQMYLDSLIQ